MEDDQDSPQKRKEAEMLALKKKIIDVFQLFDYEANNTVDMRFKCASDEELLRAFQVLDKDHKGYLLKEEVTKFMTEEGEKFNQEEIEEMMNTAVDAGTGHIQYRKYLFKFSPEDD
ncbi:dynein regulatory complex protein 8-like [Babylonia areolata]|uniref:dynein regulatory complex protein 8-like n=1 Tax=Babylonia areolata TaxID=304850 RepID=UPI003FD08994